MSMRLVDMDARRKYRGKKKKIIAEHWLFIGIAVRIMYEKKSHTHTHTWKCKKLRIEISHT